MDYTVQQQASLPLKENVMNSQEWVNAWKNSEEVKTVEMGGLGEGYEQCIQEVAATILTTLIFDGKDLSQFDNLDSDDNSWKMYIDSVFERTNPLLDNIGLSGAQHSAGANLAAVFYRRGYEDAMADPVISDRIITVQRNSTVFVD